MAVISLEKLMQASVVDRQHFFIDWIASKHDKTYKTPIPENTSNDSDITNFAHLAVYYDRADVLSLLINSNDTYCLTLQANRKQFHITHLAAQYGSIRSLSLLYKHERKRLSVPVNSPQTRFNQANIAHIAAYYGQLKVIEWIKQHHLLSLFLRKTANDESPMHFAASNSSNSVLNFFQWYYPEMLYGINLLFETVTHTAVSHNQAKALEYLLRLDRTNQNFTHAQNHQKNIAFFAVTENIIQRTQVIRLLFQKYPQLLLAQDKHQNTPLDRILNFFRSKSTNHNTVKKQYEILKKFYTTNTNQPLDRHALVQALQTSSPSCNILLCDETLDKNEENSATPARQYPSYTRYISSSQEILL